MAGVVSKKRSGDKSVSARKRFVASIDRLASYYANSPEIDDFDENCTEKTSDLLQRMRADDRMQVVWEALAEISDEAAYDGLLDEMQSARGALDAIRHFVLHKKTAPARTSGNSGYGAPAPTVLRR
jgi:hypothetical protein